MTFVPISIANDPVIDLHEDSRTYYWADHQITITDVRQLVIRSSGTHRVKTENGELYVINPGWHAIKIIDEDKKDWTV